MRWKEKRDSMYKARNDGFALFLIKLHATVEFKLVLCAERGLKYGLLGHLGGAVG